MKNYLAEFTATNELFEALVIDLNKAIYDCEITHKVFGKGHIVKVQKISPTSSKTSLYDFQTDIKFADNQLKTFHLTNSISNKFITADDTLISILAEYINVLITYQSEEEARQKRAEQLQEELRLKAEEERKAKIKLVKHEQAIKQATLRLDDIVPTVFGECNDFFVALGWLAKNTTSTNATIPDWAEPWFRKNFGYDAPAKVIDSKKVYPSGYTAAWAPCFNLKIKSKQLSQLPAILSEHLSKNGTYLAGTDFIFGLVDTYGFNFGKKQNIDDIKSHIPTQFISDFELGLSLT